MSIQLQQLPGLMLVVVVLVLANKAGHKHATREQMTPTYIHYRSFLSITKDWTMYRPFPFSHCWWTNDGDNHKCIDWLNIYRRRNILAIARTMLRSTTTIQQNCYYVIRLWCLLHRHTNVYRIWLPKELSGPGGKVETPNTITEVNYGCCYYLLPGDSRAETEVGSVLVTSKFLHRLNNSHMNMQSRTRRRPATTAKSCLSSNYKYYIEDDLQMNCVPSHLAIVERDDL